MIKLALTTMALALSISLPAHAEASKWSVSEISSVGIKAATGTWTLNNEGGKVSGTASLQFDNGNPLSYKLEGTAEGEGLTLKLLDRTDGKKNCVWTSKPGASVGGKVLKGDVACDGGKFMIQAGQQ